MVQKVKVYLSTDTQRWTVPQELAVESVNSAMEDDYYAILNVKPTESPRAIKKSYKKLALLCHPDKNSHPKAAQAMKKITNAYQILKDFQCYNEYDHQETYTTPSYDASSNIHTKISMWLLIYLVLWIVFMILAGLYYSSTIPSYSLDRSTFYSHVRYTPSLGVKYFTNRAHKHDTSRIFWTHFQIEKLYLPIVSSKCLAELELHTFEMKNMTNQNSNMQLITAIAKQKMSSCAELLELFETLKYEYIRMRQKHLAEGHLNNGWEDPLPCSKEKSEEYYLPRETSPMSVGYYVDEKFYEFYNDNEILAIDIKIEETFLSEIVDDCKSEMKLQDLMGRSLFHTSLVLKIVGHHEEYPNLSSCMEAIELFPTLTHYYLITLEAESLLLINELEAETKGESEIHSTSSVNSLWW